jgi:hypothetical protein
MALDPFQNFVAVTKDRGLEKSLRKYYGIYRAYVLRNDDEEERGRIQIACPDVGHSPDKGPGVWVSPAFAGAGDRTGWFDPPQVGAVVWVNFDLGDAGKPKVYWGGWFTEEGTRFGRPKEFRYADGQPQRRGYRSRAGHLLLFDDEPGKETVRLLWHKPASGDAASSDPNKTAQEIAAAGEASLISFEKDGSVQLLGINGSKVILDATNKQILVQDETGNLVVMDADGIKLMDQSSGGASFVHLNNNGDINLSSAKNVNINSPNVNVKSGGVFLTDGAVLSAAIAEPLIAWLATHTHGTGTGPSSPPIVPPTPTIKSNFVKLR